MRVVTCADGAAWDAYVEAAPAASNYHRWRWRAPIQETFGHAPVYLAALENDAIAGVLPLFFHASRLFGNALVSVPYFSYGGALTSSDEARAALLGRARELAAELAADRVELRQGAVEHEGWLQTSGKVVMEVPLPASEEALWGRLSSRLRNKVRRAENSGLHAEWGGAELVRDFYKVFAANMRNLGTPVYPRDWFENLCLCSPAETEILVLRKGLDPVAGAFLSRYRGAMEVPWICSTPECRRDYSSVLLYWTFLKRAIAAGCASCDLGRCTPGGGTHTFKKLWGCAERPLRWYTWTAAGAHAPETHTESGKFRLAIRLWQHLPLPLANLLGPRIVRSLP
jgi:serine/alanine adding enzyme